MKKPVVKKPARKVRKFQEIKSPLYGLLSKMEVGDSVWLEVAAGEDHAFLMKRVVNSARYPRQMREMEFSSRLHVALAVRHLTEPPVMLLNVTRWR